MNKPQFAFWSHDQFPFWLGAEVIEKRSATKFVVKGYGLVTPDFMVPLEQGKETFAKLAKLSSDRRLAMEVLDRGFNALRMDIINQLTDLTK